MSWAGQIYGRGLPQPAIATSPRIYQGTWGLAPYQGLYQPASNNLLSLALTPEWLLLAGALLVLGLLGLLVQPFAWALGGFALMAAVSLTQALRGARNSKYLIRARGLSPFAKARSFALIFA